MSLSIIKIYSTCHYVPVDLLGKCVLWIWIWCNGYILNIRKLSLFGSPQLNNLGDKKPQNVY